MFSYSFNSMPLYFSEKLINGYPDMNPPVLSDKPERELLSDQARETERE